MITDDKVFCRQKHLSAFKEFYSFIFVVLSDLTEGICLLGTNDRTKISVKRLCKIKICHLVGKNQLFMILDSIDYCFR